MKHTFELKNVLKSEIENGLSWGDIVQKYYPNEDREKFRSILWKIVNTNYDPKNNRLRERLGLVILKRIEACTVCNQIHVVICPKANKIDIPKLPVTPKIIRDRARRKAQRDELVILREENKWLRENLSTICNRYGIRFEYHGELMSKKP